MWYFQRHRTPSTKKEKAPQVKKEVPKESIDNAAREAELKQVRSQIKKAEESIEKLEAEIKSCDAQLADPQRYTELMNDQTFFAKYSALKSKLDAEVEKWDELSSKLW